MTHRGHRWWITGAVVIAALIITSLGMLIGFFGEQLSADQESLWGWLSSSSLVIHNLALTVVAVFALLFAAQRISVAERQADTAQQGLLNERYQKGAEMLGSEVLAVRLGGIYALVRLYGREATYCALL